MGVDRNVDLRSRFQQGGFETAAYNSQPESPVIVNKPDGMNHRPSVKVDHGKWHQVSRTLQDLLQGLEAERSIGTTVLDQRYILSRQTGLV